MERLVQQLLSNNVAIETLKERYIMTDLNDYYKVFSNEDERRNDLKKVLKLYLRVLRMRHRVLENIKLEAVREMNEVYAQDMSLIGVKK